MQNALWVVLIGIAAAFAWLIRHNLRKWKARQHAEEERCANFVSATTGAAPAKEPAKGVAPLPVVMSPSADGGGIVQQKLLFEAAHKAGEAGEPALAIQLYARLLARYPASGFAGQARAAVEAQKRKLAKS